jgi:hypothetical protein
MSHRNHHRKGPKNYDEEDFDKSGDQQPPKKRSLGALRKNEKTKPRSPDATGTFHFQRHTLKEMYRQLEKSGDDEVICNLAGWRNSDHGGQYLTIEISPRLASIERRRQPNSDSFYDMFNDDNE